MEELTNVVEDVVTDVAEEVVTKVGLGTVVTGVCAATGAVAIAYGAIKGVQWVYKTVKAARDNKVEVLNADEVEHLDINDVEEE